MLHCGRQDTYLLSVSSPYIGYCGINRVVQVVHKLSKTLGTLTSETGNSLTSMSSTTSQLLASECPADGKTIPCGALHPLFAPPQTVLEEESLSYSALFTFLQKERAHSLSLWTFISALLSVVNHSSACLYCDAQIFSAPAD